MLKTYKVKLKTNHDLDLSLKRMSGTYRKIYNFCLNALVYRVEVNPPKEHWMSGTELAKVAKMGIKTHFPFLKEMDSGLLPAAAIAASSAFRFRFNYKPDSVPYLSRKKSNLRFRTVGNVRINEDHIIIPKLGKIPLTEKGRIPTGEGVKHSNISFKHDGVNWFICVSVETPVEVGTSDSVVFLDFTNDGDVILNGNIIEGATKSFSYKNNEKKYKHVYKKYLRQAKANTVVKKERKIVIPTKNKIKSKKRLDKLNIILYNVRENKINHIIHEVAITKPKELHILDNRIIRSERNNYLTRNHRKSGSRKILDTLKRKLSTIGTKVVRHSSQESFQRALGSRD